MHASGSGEVVVACYGALEKVTLAAGERYTLDTGHMVAYDPRVQMTLRKANTSLMQTIKSGEGFVFEFTGPGDVWIQSRNPSALVTLADDRPPLLAVMIELFQITGSARSPPARPSRRSAASTRRSTSTRAGATRPRTSPR